MNILSIYIKIHEALHPTHRLDFKWVNESYPKLFTKDSLKGPLEVLRQSIATLISKKNNFNNS